MFDSKPSAESTRPSEVLYAEHRRREKTARVLALAFTLLGIPGTLAAYSDPYATHIWALVALTSIAFALYFALGFTNLRKQVIPLLVPTLLVQHLAIVMATPRHVFSPTPFFTAIAIYVASIVLTLPGVLVAIAAVFLDLILMTRFRFGTIDTPQDEVEAIAPFLLALTMGVIAVIQSLYSAKTLSIQIEREKELRRARTEARENFERFRLLSSHTDDLVLLVGRDLAVRFASPSHGRVLGVAPDDLDGRPFVELLHADDREDAAAVLTRAGRTSERTDVRVETEPGKHRWFELATRQVEIEGDPFVVISMRDVHERLALTQELEFSRRLESLGRLAGAVAHDFNNLLTIVGGGAENALNAIDQKQLLKSELRDILTAVDKASTLTREILLFGKRLARPLTRLDIAETMRSLEHFAARLVPERIQLGFVLEVDRLLVLADQTQVEQVVLNLITNARDAIPDRGRITVRLCQEEPTRARRSEASLSLGFAVIEVRDDGRGIPDEIKHRLFEPYFTTKSERKGTGLGLSTVQGIVQRLGGTIELESQLGVGTTFRIRIPLAREAGSDDARGARTAAATGSPDDSAERRLP